MLYWGLLLLLFLIRILLSTMKLCLRAMMMLNMTDKGMQVMFAFNHFGRGLIERIPRCRHEYFHVMNIFFTEWNMYAIGGSADPRINSQGNQYIAPPNADFKERRLRSCVTDRHLPTHAMVIQNAGTNNILNEDGFRYYSAEQKRKRSETLRRRVRSRVTDCNLPTLGMATQNAGSSSFQWRY